MDNRIIEDINRLVLELGTAPNVNFLNDTLAHIKSRFSQDPELGIDIYFSEKPLTDSKKGIFDWITQVDNQIDNQARYKLEVYLKSTILPLKISDLKSAICLIILDEGLIDNVELSEYLKFKAAQYAKVIVLNDSSDTNITNHLSGFGFRVRPDIYNFNEINQNNFGLWLMELCTKDQIRTIIDKSFYNTLDPLLKLAEDSVAEETRLIQVKKNLNAQSSIIIKREETSFNINDLSSTTRANIQQWCAENEKRTKQCYDDLNKINIGEYHNFLTNEVNKITDFDRTEQAEKSEKWLVSVPGKFLDNFRNTVYEKLKNDFNKDFESLQRSQKELLKQLDADFSSKGLKSNFSATTQESLDFNKYLNSNVTFLKNYSGEVVKKGAVEYFVALREYTGIIMVVGGMLAPFTIIANVSDSGFFKSMGVGLRVAVAVVTLAMVLYGFFDLRKRIPRKRREEFERELKRAREFVLNEGRRMFVDSTKDWIIAYSNYMRDLNTMLIQHSDRCAKEYTAEKLIKMNDERSKADRTRLAIDNLSKKVGNAEKLLSDIKRHQRDKETDIEKQIRL